MFSLNLLFEVVIVYPELPVKLASYFDSLAASVIYTFLFNDLEIVLFQFLVTGTGRVLVRVVTSVRCHSNI